MKYLKLLSITVLLLIITNCTSTKTPPPAPPPPAPTPTCTPSLTLNKMNVFYIGVNNPITIESNGVSQDDLRISIIGGTIRKANSPYEYVVTVSRPGTAKITVSNTSDSKLTEFKYRVKRIPNPVARLNNNKGNTMSSGEFKATQGVIAVLENFDFDARCQIQGFVLGHIREGQKTEEASNTGARYAGRTSELAKKAKPGDTYYFTNVKVRCPGDNTSRHINSMVFNIR